MVRTALQLQSVDTTSFINIQSSRFDPGSWKNQTLTQFSRGNPTFMGGGGGEEGL